MPIKIFCCYDPKDEKFQVDLDTCLKPLERSGQVSSWSEHKIPGGANRIHESEKHLRETDVVLLLVSPDFLASDYCQKILQQATDLHKSNKIFSIIPIIVRPAEWKQDGIGELQPLPKNETPISKWRNKDEAWLDVGMGIKEVVELFLSQPRQQAVTTEGFLFIGQYPTNGYRWDNDLRPAPGLVKQGNVPDAPRLISQAVGILEISHRYSIFEKNDVLRNFATLSPTADAVKQFADRHGFLGKLIPLIYPGKIGQPDSILWVGEALQFWLEEIEEMNILVTFWDMIRGRQIEALKEHIIWRLNPVDVLFVWKSQNGRRGAVIASKELSPELLYQWEWGEYVSPALHYLRTQINERLKGHINLTLFTSQKNEFYMIPDSLRSALYMLLSMEVKRHSITP